MSGQKRTDPYDDDRVSPWVLAILLVYSVLAHPWQTLKRVSQLALGLVLSLGRWVGRFVLGLFRLVFFLVWSRMTERRPTFEEFLRRHDDEDEDPRPSSGRQDGDR